jgi:hypothetical protein
MEKDGDSGIFIDLFKLFGVIYGDKPRNSVIYMDMEIINQNEEIMGSSSLTNWIGRD